MTVVFIEEENHGFIGMAKDFHSAIDFLINRNWLSDSTECWWGEGNNYASIKEILGEDWVDEMHEWGIENFNEFWLGSFWLHEEPVYPTE
jgi:hypothetical protein